MSTIQLQEQNKQPSAKLQEKIKSCAQAFRSLKDIVNELIDLGREEGFEPLEIGQLIRQEMLKSGLSRMTVTRYLPAEFKALPRGKPSGNNISNTKLLKFEGIISSKGDNRKAINIPVSFHAQIGDHKKFIVTLKPID
jgi:hypothetical protein